ncbi:ATP-binding protein [Desulfurispira natronophila]|uniref:histidine kinase n=1 Tax=Desulfurispira natronophila TaxID=682562 RepID=A0A7W8DHM0_9BACT|nr:ATP-binding protein [Desulfurispira natronophila]MBB5022589.1 signal transduction histidine kinase [Desulfurispira natronophila]
MSTYGLTHRSLRNYALTGLVAWLCIMTASLAWNTHILHQHTLEGVRSEAMVSMQRDIAVRQWFARHGGVYVFSDLGTEPNPYLSDHPLRDLQANGKSLTLINPAYFIRLFNQDATECKSVASTRIVGFNPTHAPNAPDDWETMALHHFKRAEQVSFQVVKNQEGSSMRGIAPFIVQESCLECHAAHNSLGEPGDIAGAITVKLDMEPALQRQAQSWQWLLFNHGMVALLGTGAIGMVYRNSRRRLQESNEIQEDLRVNRERLNMALDCTGDSVYDYDVVGRRVRFTATEYQRLGLAQSDTEGYLGFDQWITTIHSDDQAILQHAIQESLVDKKNYIEHRFRQKDANGTYRWIYSRGKIVERDNHGKATRIMGIHSDITHLVLLEQSLWDLNEHLEERVAQESDKRHKNEELLVQQSRMAAMGEMIGAISHQWKQPLNVLGILVQDLGEAYEHGEINRNYLNETASHAMAQIDYMAHTIDDFRNFFHPNKERENFNVKQAIKSAVKLVSAQLNNHQIEVVISGNEDVRTCGQRNEFQQVVLNIINNARDAIVAARNHLATCQSGCIWIDITASNQGATIQITDNGGGIDQSIIERIFDPYFSTKEDTAGTGIGLSMARTLLEQGMGGTITAGNVEGGACFTITVPPSCESNL